jgi:hypothetical protein
MFLSARKNVVFVPDIQTLAHGRFREDAMECIQYGSRFLCDPREFSQWSVWINYEQRLFVERYRVEDHMAALMYKVFYEENLIIIRIGIHKGGTMC